MFWRYAEQMSTHKDSPEPMQRFLRNLGLRTTDGRQTDAGRTDDRRPCPDCSSADKIKAQLKIRNIMAMKFILQFSHFTFILMREHSMQQFYFLTISIGILIILIKCSLGLQFLTGFEALRGRYIYLSLNPAP